MTTAAPDIFSNVHKGIRKALFDACLALGRAGADLERGAAARALLKDALRFVAHHGDNEDQLLVPLLEARAPELAKRLRDAHAPLEVALRNLTSRLATAAPPELYPQSCDFTARYLEHMHDEEQVLEPAIRAVLSVDELVTFGQRAVERTAPADQRMMLGWMLPAMTAADVEAFLARVPAALREELRPLSR